MGSGCTPGCADGLFESRYPDTQVKYTGPAIPELGICTGDLLSEVEATLIKKILEFASGHGFNLSEIDLTTCEAFADCISCCEECTDLICILNCYKDAICELWDLVKDALDGPYDTKCLTGVTSNSKLKEIVQALINQYCALKAAHDALQIQVNNLQNQVNNLIANLPNTIGNFLSSHINTCQGSSGITKTGTGANVNLQFQGFTPIGGIIMYTGSTAGKFDSTGRGISGTDMCGWALCNGNNGTVDMREQTPVGAGQGAMGGAGSIPSNASGANYGAGQLFGQATVQLTAAQSGLVGHGHNVKIFPHSHRMKFLAKKIKVLTSLSVPATWQEHNVMSHGGDTSTIPYAYERPYTDTNGQPIWAYINEDYGVNMGQPGSTYGEVSPVGDQNAREAHPNIQPSRALLFIQRIA